MDPRIALVLIQTDCSADAIRRASDSNRNPGNTSDQGSNE
jgi:hypothetical protein